MKKVNSKVAKRVLNRSVSSTKDRKQFKMKLGATKAFCGSLCMPSQDFLLICFADLRVLASFSYSNQ